MDNGYKLKINCLVDLTKKMFENIPVQDNLIYIDGGEMVGTSTLVEGIKAFDKDGECVYTREPSRETKKAIINRFGERAFVDTEFVKDIIDMFMKDRKINQAIGNGSQTVSDAGASGPTTGKPIISDRGIFSTIVYQSGILDPQTSIEDIIINCSSIYETAVINGIKMPKLAINLVTTDNNSQADQFEFMKRLNKRIGNKEQELDALDNIADTMVINKVYSDLSIGLGNSIPSYHAFEFKWPVERIKLNVIKLIQDTYN